ncbi:hypothetical protein AX17_000930 [Amanita inopinata Kibby_2008]|nr:hypothetical protein AX17_000930 [Amanita inopinata Kibby_2008]
MVARHAQLYRGILNELKKSAVNPSKKNRQVITHVRSVAEKCRQSANVHGLKDLENALLFLHSQREHKALLHRYNPSYDYTSEERIKATANRVGLDMPVMAKAE